MTEKNACRIAALVILSLLLANVSTAADPPMAVSVGQTVYIPIYSHIYSGDRERPVYLAATLSIRNVQSEGAILITAVDYYDSDGKLLKSYLDAPLELAKMASIRYVVKQSDKKGGSGANFIVKWQSPRKVVPPLIEAVMISTQNQQGISFSSRGRVVSERGGGSQK